MSQVIEQIQKDNHLAVIATGKDEFDDRSIHLSCYVETVLCAYMKMTPGADAYFESVHGRRGNIPTGVDVIDLNRAIVAVRVWATVSPIDIRWQTQKSLASSLEER
jgi:hypothetical protein